MNHEEFEKIFEAVVQRSRNVLLAKGKEYASEEDRLHNFRVAGALQGCTPEQALGGMLAKHLVSIFDLLGDMDDFNPGYMAIWEEKMGDSLNYIILLWALLEERFQELYKEA